MEEQNFSTLIEFINAMEVREDDEEFKNPVDLMFDALEAEKPNHFAVRQYKKYKLAAGKTAKSILISCGARLAVFDIAELREVTSYDELELDISGTLRRKEEITLAYVPVPKDLTKVKTKVMFNLTKRQLICFTGGALIGVPLFFLLRQPAGNSVAAMCMMLVMLPFFMLAMYEKPGQPLEKIVGNIIKVAIIRPKQRPYQTNNFYAVLKRQEMLDKEVYDIVYGKQKQTKAGKRRADGKVKD